MTQEKDGCLNAFEREFSNKDLARFTGTNVNLITGVEKQIWIYHNRNVQFAWEAFQAAWAMRENERRDIGTAPKDGRWIDAYNAYDGYRLIVRWMGNCGNDWFAEDGERFPQKATPPSTPKRRIRR